MSCLSSLFGNFWHSQLSILSRDADMVQQTCIWLCGQAIWILTSVTPGVLHALLQAILIHVRASKICSQPWIIVLKGMEFSFFIPLMLSL